MAFTALFDACVLYPMSLRDVLLSLAITDLFRARWSARIHEEWVRAVLRTRPELEKALLRTRELMDEAIPDANVEGFEFLEASLQLPDPDDRHILAAAIVGRVDVIVTANTKHFPPAALVSANIECQHPDEFVAHVLTLEPPVALAAIKQLRARLKNPPFSAEDYLALLSRQGLPQTVAILRESIALI